MDDVRPPAPEDPRRVGDYEITGRLGEGGQGTVYLGHRVEAAGGSGAVAIKLLHGRVMADDTARTRFFREVTVTQRVARFCTAQVLDVGTAGDRPYIVSEYVRGPSLQRVVRAEGPRSGAALDRLAINTATALAAIHRAGVVHRDFKPANVLMGPDGPVVIDFGIARALDAGTATLTGQTVGTPSYMAPEQLVEGDVGPEADMFAWAVTMVYAATGMPAFGQTSIPVVINRILHDEPDLGALDEPLRGLVVACLAKDPARRPTASRLMHGLLGQDEPAEPGRRTMVVSPPPPSGAVPPPSSDAVSPGATRTMPVARRRSGMAMPAVAVAVLVAVAVVAVFTTPLGRLVGRGEASAERPMVDVASPSPSASRTPGGASESPEKNGPSHKNDPPGRDGKGRATAKVHKPKKPKKKGERNPYTPRKVCGAGYRVIDRHRVGAATVYLLYNGGAGRNCVVTMVSRSTGKVRMNATLRVKGGKRHGDAGRFKFYAGPVRLAARNKCVSWGGAYTKRHHWASGWTHCG